jgi:hypothetical protein
MSFLKMQGGVLQDAAVAVEEDTIAGVALDELVEGEDT